MTFLRSLIFNVLWYLWTFAMSITCFITIPMPMRYSLGVGWLWNKGTTFLLRWICSVRIEIRHRERIPDGGYVVACKHQSAWETGVFLELLPWAVYTPKIELLSIPLFGHSLKKLAHIGIDRKAGTKALRDLINGAQDAIDNGRQLVIFPEGRRVGVDESAKYHPGVAAIYSKTNTRVLPAALNSGLCWGRNSFMKHPGTIVLEFLPVIEPGMKRNEFLPMLEEQIETRSRELVEEFRPSAPKE